MRALYINRSSRKDRKKYFKKHIVPFLIQCGFQVKRFKAIEGSNYTDDEWKIGATGCFASHIEIYKKAVKTHDEDEMVAIFEDDVLINASVDEFQQALDTAPQDADILYLGGIPSWMMEEMPKEIHNKNKWVKINGMLNTHAMIVKTSFMKKFIDAYAPNDAKPPYGPPEHVDWALMKYCKNDPDVNVYIYRPSLTSQNITLTSDVKWSELKTNKEFDFSNLISTLQSEQEWEYIPNIGNLGDSVIAKTSFKLFDDLAIAIKPFNPDGSLPILVSGGGNFISLYNEYDGTRKALESVTNKSRKIVFLPCTIQGDENIALVKQFSNATVFVREWMTQKLLRDNGIAALKSDDLAFLLDVSHYKNKKTGTSLLSLRDDKEVHKDRSRCSYCNNKHIFDAITDISSGEVFNTYLKGTEWNREETEKWADKYIHEINKFDCIVTDRLHAGIIGTLLGKQVYLIDNSYHKNREVFRRSIRSRFGNCKFIHL